MEDVELMLSETCNRWQRGLRVTTPSVAAVCCERKSRHCRRRRGSHGSQQNRDDDVRRGATVDLSGGGKTRR